MPRRKGIDTPNWAINAGEKVQGLEDRLPLSALIRRVAGSNSPAYIQARWYAVDQIVGFLTEEPAELPIAEADPDASLLTIIPRLKKKAAILGSDHLELNKILEEHNASPAVAYSYRGETHAGLLPLGIYDLSLPFNSASYLAAMRTGRNDFGAAIGGWLQEERVFIKPDGTSIRQNVPIDKLPPGVPLL
jgi:hypothetical protein